MADRDDVELMAAIYDEELNQLLSIDGETESGIYLSALGHPQSN